MIKFTRHLTYFFKDGPVFWICHYYFGLGFVLLYFKFILFSVLQLILPRCIISLFTITDFPWCYLFYCWDTSRSPEYTVLYGHWVIFFIVICNDKETYKSFFFFPVSLLWHMTELINMTFLMSLEEEMLWTFLCQNLIILVQVLNLGVASCSSRRN